MECVPPITKYCTICGKPFLINTENKPAWIVKQLSKRECCSTSCRAMLRKEHYPPELVKIAAIKAAATRKRLLAEGKLQPYQHTEEAKDRMRLIRLATAKNPDHIAKVKALPVHTPGTPEYEAKRKKISATRIERHIMPSEDQVEQWQKRMKEWISVNGGGRKGKKLTESQRKHLSFIHIGLQAGDKHPNWRGGIGREKYGNGWSRPRRRMVKERDHNICQLCFVDLIETQIRSSVHHIDFDKQHNTFDNLILLCHKCNCRVNFNRDYWIAHFQAIMRTKEMVEANSRLPLAHLNKVNKK